MLAGDEQMSSSVRYSLIYMLTEHEVLEMEDCLGLFYVEAQCSMDSKWTTQELEGVTIH